MAKKNLSRLAGLAALAGAGAAYMASKGKYNEDAGKQTTSSYTGDTKKVEAGGASLESPEDTIKRSMVKAPGDSKPIIANMPEEAAPVTPKSTKFDSAADEPAGLTTPVSSANRTDQLTNLSRAVKREANTKKFAREVPEELSALKTDALRVSSRAAAAADARRRAAKQSSYKSGGMTASRRGDGIASRGKTRGKMY